MDSEQTRQNQALAYLQSYMTYYNQLMTQSLEIINRLISQNNFIDRQINYTHNHHDHNNGFPNFQKENEIFNDSHQNQIKLDHFDEMNLFNNPNQQMQKQQMPEFRDFPSKSQSIQLEKKIKQKAQQKKYQNQASSNKLNNQEIAQKKPKYLKRQRTGCLQDVPGNPLENRLIAEFFEKKLPQIITITGTKQSRIFKKQLLTCYIIWRLNQLPNQTKLKLVNIQVNISAFIRISLKTKCEILRHTYSGMEFKSLQTVKQITHFDLNRFKIYEKRGRAPGDQYISKKQPRHIQLRSTRNNQANKN